MILVRRSFSSASLVVGLIVLTLAILWSALAHAADAPPAAEGWPIEAWILVGLSAAAGLETVLRGLRTLVGLFKARTATTVDDRAYDRLGQAADAIADVRNLFGRSAPKPPGAGPAVLLLVLLAGGLAMQTACGASQRESTIKAALVTADASREAFLAYDSSRQQQIVEAAVSLDDGRAKLDEYRGKRTRVEQAFGVLYRAIAMAATLDGDRSMAALTAALSDVVAIVGEIMKESPQ